MNIFYISYKLIDHFKRNLCSFKSRSSKKGGESERNIEDTDTVSFNQYGKHNAS